MSDVPKCGDAEIQDWVGQRSIRLGREYVADGSVSDTTVRGRKLRAKVQGTADRPYRVSITFDDDGIAAAYCSCPVGDGGGCKHVAAVLLKWRDDPDAFEPTEPVERALEQRSKPELIALIRLMLKHEPDLETLVAMPLPGASSGGGVKSDAYRKQAVAAMNRAGGEWGWHRDAAEQLEAIRELGDEFLERRDAASAAAVFQGVAEALDEDARSGDEAGDLFGVVADCAAGLARCLHIEKDPKRREAVLEAMFQIYLLDLDMGGVDLAPDVPEDIVNHATPDERRLVAVWVRDKLPGADRDWGREELGAFLLDLEKDRLDDEAYLRICKQTGRVDDLVDRLLTMGRDAEAIKAAGAADDHDLLRLADVLARHGRAEEAHDLVAGRAATSKDTRLLHWLHRRAAAQGNDAGQVDLARRIFQLEPSLDGYRELRQLARKRGEWDGLRPTLLSALKANRPDLLIDVALCEGDIDQALALTKSSRLAWYGEMELKVARAAEALRPREALTIYRKRAEACINQRNRDAYQRACEYLKKVQALHGRMNETAVWKDYVTALRERHRSLRAFQDELRAAKL